MKLKNEEGFILSAVKLDYKATGSKLWDTGAGIDKEISGDQSVQKQNKFC